LGHSWLEYQNSLDTREHRNILAQDALFAWTGNGALAIVTTIIKGTIVNHIDVGVIEGMSVRNDVIMRRRIPIYIRRHN
jgi:hypothetical protein